MRGRPQGAAREAKDSLDVFKAGLDRLMAGAVKRSGRSETRQVAALPWRRGEQGVQVMLVTSRETRRWVVPKGGRMAGKTDPEAAAVEAMEEAGVQGEVSTVAHGVFRYARLIGEGELKRYVVALYPLMVRIQLGHWPEAHERQRRWMSQEEAAASVQEPDLAELILSFRAPPKP